MTPIRISSKARQRGTTAVEFAIVGLVSFTILFGAIEVSRLLFTANMLEEATRRGARMAVVCEVDDPAIQQATVFNLTGGNDSPLFSGLTTANVSVQYLDENGGPIAGYAGDTAEYYRIRYVRVAIVDYTYDFIVPGYETSFVTNEYATVLPIESLGIHKGGERSTCV